MLNFVSVRTIKDHHHQGKYLADGNNASDVGVCLHPSHAPKWKLFRCEHSPTPCIHERELLCDTCDGLLTMSFGGRSMGCIKASAGCLACIDSSQQGTVSY
jgi:hypothetical protein